MKAGILREGRESGPLVPADGPRNHERQIRRGEYTGPRAQGGKGRERGASLR